MRAAVPLPLFLASCASTLDEPFVLNDDGGWCWFQDERALALGDVVVVGSVAAGRSDPSRHGDVELTYWWPESGRIERVELHDRLELDDHNVPALLELEDGGLLAVYAKHGTDHLLRHRRTTPGAGLLAWQPEGTLEIGADQRLGVTYANLHHAGGEVLDFCRSVDWDPNLVVSRDSGVSWEHVGRVLGGPGRPYVKYASDGSGPVHFVATEQHPRDFDNGLYHGFVRGRDVHASDGRRIGSVGDAPPAPRALTRVFEGAPDRVAWPADVELDADGNPVVLFTVQVDGAGLPPRQGGFDHRFYYAHYTGRSWRVREMGYAGTRLYAGEDDYTGLGAIDPADPWTVYVSTDADPLTGAPLVSAADGERHRELFRLSSEDRGASWSATPLTRDSEADNLRPIVPRGTPRTLLWLRGELRSYTDYTLEVVARELP